MSAATDTAAPCFYSYRGRFSIFIPIWLPMEVIYNLSRKIKQHCDNWPLSTLSGFQVCKTNVAAGWQHPVCCAFWCRFLLPGRWLGSCRWKKRAEINNREWSSHVREGWAGSSCGSCPLTWLSGAWGVWGSALVSERYHAVLRVPNYSCHCGQLK